MKTNLIKIRDYRNTSYNYYDFSLGEKKNDFKKKFIIDHPRVRNVHLTIKNRENKYNFEFRKIYYEKCAYCGISTQVIDSSRFEVDHVIPVSILKQNSGYKYEEINGLGNLVSSCQMCNRGKTNFYCENEEFELLHPDNDNLPKIFERSKDYSIEISVEYKSSVIIKEFYTRLKLDNQLRRLDYLLMEMKDFCDMYEGEPIINDIQRIINRIESKRRRNY